MIINRFKVALRIQLELYSHWLNGGRDGRIERGRSLVVEVQECWLGPGQTW